MHEIAGFSVINQISQCSGWKGNDRCAAGQGLHGHQRAGLGCKTWGQEASGAGQEPPFPFEAYGADVSIASTKPGPDFFPKVTFVGFVPEHFTGQDQGSPGFPGCLKGQMIPFLRTDPSKGKSEMSLADPKVQLIYRHPIFYIR